jgi:uncharacterized membrane protein
MTLKTPWLTPAGLLLLCVVPILAGLVRMSEIASGLATPDNIRFLAQPLPGTLHIFAVTFFCMLGAFQFVPALRVGNVWHRHSGRLLVPLGLVTAITGLWMNQFYALPPHDGIALYILRLIFGLAMFAALILGLFAIRRRDYTAHRAWMTRGYAIGLGAGTQVLTNAPWMMLIGEPDVGTRAVLMGAGWVINVLVAEWIIRRQTASPVPEFQHGRA